MGVMHGLLRSGLRVPEQVSVIGFDDIEDAASTRPTLSTIAPGRDEIASRALTPLQDRIGSQLSSSGQAPSTPAATEAGPLRRCAADRPVSRPPVRGMEVPGQA